MPAHRKTSLAQIMELIMYLEKHKDIQLGTTAAPTRGLLLKRENEHWQKLSRILNKCPGEPKDTAKWKSYWSELKWHCRKKTADGRNLRPYEQRVMNLIGMITKDPVSVLPRDGCKIEPKEDTIQERLDDNSDGANVEMDYDNSRLPLEDRDQECTTPDPMPTEDIAVEAQLSDQEEEEEEKEQEDLPSEDVPEWVRKVEHSRLALEERTTLAIEQMSAGINSIAGTMHRIVGSLQSIEASIRALNNTSNLNN